MNPFTANPVTGIVHWLRLGEKRLVARWQWANDGSDAFQYDRSYMPFDMYHGSYEIDNSDSNTCMIDYSDGGAIPLAPFTNMVYL